MPVNFVIKLGIGVSGLISCLNVDTTQPFSILSPPISSFITKLTGITNEMVWGAPTFTAIAQDLEDFLHGSIFVAHHVNFDYSFIKAEFKRIGITYNSDRICSVRLSRLLHPEQGRHSLDKVIERLGINVENRHRAYDDAEVIWKFIEDELRADETRLFRSLQKVMVHSRPSPSEDLPSYPLPF